MKNSKLFLICPDAHLELFIRKRYGTDVFFLTALGGVFNFEEQSYLEAVLGLIEREGIGEIIFVNDTSCRFINSVLEADPRLATSAEYALLDLLIRHYYYVMRGTAPLERERRLAALNIQHQAEELLSTAFFQQPGLQDKVAIKGLISTKALGKTLEIPITPTKQMHESALTDR